uniref:Uncharacterized protein n=1 Tax=Aegilops tauschii TaxID=37682 RepID=M8D0Y9_AEGTA
MLGGSFRVRLNVFSASVEGRSALADHSHHRRPFNATSAGRLQPVVAAPGASTPRPPSSVPQKSVNSKASKTRQLEIRSTSVAENVHKLLCDQFLRSTVGCGSLLMFVQMPNLSQLGATREGAMQQSPTSTKIGVIIDGTRPDADAGLANLAKNYFVLKEQLCFVGQAQPECKCGWPKTVFNTEEQPYQKFMFRKLIFYNFSEHASTDLLGAVHNFIVCELLFQILFLHGPCPTRRPGLQPKLKHSVFRTKLKQRKQEVQKLGLMYLVLKLYPLLCLDVGI